MAPPGCTWDLPALPLPFLDSGWEKKGFWCCDPNQSCHPAGHWILRCPALPGGFPRRSPTIQGSTPQAARAVPAQLQDFLDSLHKRRKMAFFFPLFVQGETHLGLPTPWRPCTMYVGSDRHTPFLQGGCRLPPTCCGLVPGGMWAPAGAPEHLEQGQHKRGSEAATNLFNFYLFFFLNCNFGWVWTTC